VPEEARRDGPPWPPCIAQLGHLRGVRPVTESLDLGDGRLEGHVAGRPDVGPPEDHQQVDRRRPRPDARDGLERVVDGVIVKAWERVEIERP